MPQYQTSTASPSTSDDLWGWSATDIAAAVRDGSISAEEVARSTIARIHEVNPKLNALTEVLEDAAIAAARIADEQVRRGESLGPLHGVPVATKINSDHEGQITSYGVAAWAGLPSQSDSPQVGVLRKAGAVFVGRTNSPALSKRWFTENDIHGRTLNPWDASRTPGGSSGGASSAVASGMAAIAQGSDIGGSIRYPAYACGIVGLRPTPGLVPSTTVPSGQDPFLSPQIMDVQGPLARNVNDVALAFGAMCGFDHRDPISLPITPIAPPARHPRRVGLMRGGAIAALSPAVGAALEQSAVWLQEAGYEVEEIDTAILTEAYRLWYLLCLEEFRLTMPVAEEVGDQGMKTAARHYYDNAVKWWGKSPTKEVFIAGYARRGTLIAQLQELMEDYSLLLTPVSAEQAFIQDADIASPEDMGRIMDAQWPSMSLALLGFPGLSVPTGIAHGLPTGVQIVGRRFGETEMLEAGRAIEREAGVFTPVDPRE